jgi:hypothetical protein
MFDSRKRPPCRHFWPVAAILADSAAREEVPMSAGEAPIKQAVKWIDDELHDHPDADRMGLIDQASRRFDLSPLDAEFLVRHLAERASKRAD